MGHRIEKTNSANGTSESPKPESLEFATARFLIDHGFYPTETLGMVRHITGRNLGRTLGSVWQAMHLLLDSRFMPWPRFKKAVHEQKPDQKIRENPCSILAGIGPQYGASVPQCS